MNEVKRRDFLKILFVFLASLMAAILGGPLIAFILEPFYQEKYRDFVKVQGFSSLPENKVSYLSFQSLQHDSFFRQNEIQGVWVIKHAKDKAAVYSPICTHLGCRVNWQGDWQKFVCPCHGSVFNADGLVVSGPAPRPLDTLVYKIENGDLYVQWKIFKSGSGKREKFKWHDKIYLNTWINRRFPLEKFLHWSLHEEIPGGARFSYTLGSAALFLFVIQILTGVWQLFYYVPTIDHAYESLTYLRRSVPFGWLIHGLHYWGATAFTIIVGLHVVRVFIWGAYKKPREMVWLAGVSLLFMTAVFMLTGPILPWDKHGYWAAQVGLNIASSTPVMGPLIQDFLQGSAHLGQVTLSRIYLIHVAFLPAVMAFMVMVHLIAFRQFGSTGPWDPQKRKIKGQFWPDQIFKDTLVAFCILMLLIALSAFVPAPYSGPADPQDTTYAAKPEWNFLFIYQSLKPFKGQWERVGTLGIPLTILLLLLSLPFVDRSQERNPFKRVFVMSCGMVLVGFILYMTYTGLLVNTNGIIQGENSFSERASSQNPIPDEVEQKQRIAQGRYLFYKYCAECHTINGKPNGLQGPDLLMKLSNNPPSREWLKAQLISPQKHFSHTTMPAFNYLGGSDRASLLDFLQSLSLKTQITAPPEKLLSSGAILFKTIGCAGCHTVDGHSADTNGPDLLMALSVRHPSKSWLKAQIAAPQRHFSNTSMPSYSYLHKEQMDALIDYLKTLEPKPYPPVPVVKMLSHQTPILPLKQNDIGQADHIVGEWEHGKVIYAQYCMLCHNPANKNVPSLNPIRQDRYSDNADDFVERIDPIIQHGSHAMPAFAGQMLSQGQIADVEAYILHLNGVDRAQIINPGIGPKDFFYILGSIILLLIISAGLFLWKKRN